MTDILKSLKEIIKKYPEVISDDKKLKAILKDYFPDDKRIQNHLYMVADEGILEDMQSGGEIKKFKALGYIRSLSDDYGISEAMAKDAVVIWAKALKIKIEDVKVDDSKNTGAVKREGDVIDYSDSKVEDMEVKGKIIKFSGTGPKIMPNVILSGGGYIIRVNCKERNLIVNYIDKNGRSYSMVNGDKETVYSPSPLIDYSIPGIIRVHNISDKCKWEIEMLPIN